MENVGSCVSASLWCWGSSRSGKQIRSLRVVLFGFGVLLAAGSAALAGPVLIGSDESIDALVQIDTEAHTSTQIGHLDDPIVAGLGWDPNHNILYGSSTHNDVLLTIDPNTAATSVVGSFGVSLMHAVEYDSNHDVLYGITNQSGTKALYTINVTTGRATWVGFHNISSLSGLAFDAENDVMYASSTSGTGALHTINLTDGSHSLVGSFNAGILLARLGTGLAYDPLLGMFASDNSRDELYRIDMLTGQATLWGPIFPGNMLGLAIVPEPTSLLLFAFGVLEVLRRRSRRASREGRVARHGTPGCGPDSIASPGSSCD